MAKYLKNLIRTKKDFVFLIFFYCISAITAFSILYDLIYPAVVPALENAILMPSDDGLVWEETPKGIVLQEIHNPYVNLLEIGDILVKIDQQPVFSLQSLQEILKSLPPGSVMMYQIKRPSANNDLIQVLVRTYPQVIFKPEKHFFQWIYQIFNIASLFGGIFLLLLVYPFINNKKLEALKLYLYGIFAIAFCLFYLLLDFQPTIYQENTEIYFNYLGWIISVLLLFLASIALRWKAFYWDLPLDWALFGAILYFMMIPKNLISFQETIPILSSIMLLKAFLLNLHFRNKNSFYTLITSLLSISIVIIVFFPGTYSYIFLWIFMLIFNIYWIYQYLKISKVNLVAQQFVLIIVLITVFSTSYFLSGFISQQFPYDFQNIIKIILSLTVSVVVMYILFLNKNWWKKWLFFSFEKRVEKLQKFQISMINYLHKEYLLEDFKKEIYDFLGDVKLNLLIDIEKDNRYYPLLPYFYQNSFWAKSRELIKNPINIPEDLLNLIDPDIELIFPLIFSNEKKGLILIGKKKDGYYNLEEAEILQRTIIQLSLIINLLSLLEKEKLLVQKTLEANLTALRSQINPHFLFNTLNTISSLIHDAPDLAEEAVEHLAFIFRYTLKTSSEQFATLKDEMQLIRHYLDIEKIRFGKRLNIDIQIEEECLDTLIPSLVIQTLVENCIKHGISKLTKDGLIQIKFFKENEFLTGIIYDNGPGIQMENIHKGTGLNNILTRLEQIYGKNHTIQLENTGNGTKVLLKIPIKKA